MKKLLLILFIASGCVSLQPSCQTYSYKTKNLSNGNITTNVSDVLYYPGDIVCQLPDKTKFLILDVKLN